MKAVLATGIPAVDRYILSVHADILIIDKTDNPEQCREVIKVHRPDLVVLSDKVIDCGTLPLFIEETSGYSRGMKIIYLCTSGFQGCGESVRHGVHCLCSPATGQDLSRLLYSVGTGIPVQPEILAVWSPKPGDGASLVAGSLAYLLWQSRNEETDKTGVLDFNIRIPGLKYRLGLDDKAIIEELLPFIAAGCLTPETLIKHAGEIPKKAGLYFIGGIRRPELAGRYSATHFNAILNAAGGAFGKTVVDAGSILDNPGTITALKNANRIFAVLQPDYVSRQCLKHSIALFPSYGINPNKVKVLINRYHYQRAEDPEAVIKGLNLELCGVLPDLDPGAFRAEEGLLFDNPGDKSVLAYFNALRDVLEKYGLISIPVKRGGNAILPRIFMRGA